jgi:hypothetical protein
MNRLMSQAKANEGTALLLTVGYLAAITIFASTFLGFLNRTASNRNSVERQQICLNIAEGGVDKALAELRTNPNDYRGEKNTSLGAGRFSVEVEQSDQAGTYRVVSTGELFDGTFVISRMRIIAEVTLSPNGTVRELRWSEVKKR